MKKIWAVTMVKNEADIIESFCRYTLCYSDGMIIHDDITLNNTKEIILTLASEGLNIVLPEKRPPAGITASINTKSYTP